MNDKTSPGDVGAKNEMIATVWLLEQGYDVFRNVSPNGPVDIIAMKDGKTLLFDVKGVSEYKGKASSPRISQHQKDLGVAVLKVSSVGCEVDWNPRHLGATDYRNCSHCSAVFVSHTESHKVFCSKRCQQKSYRAANPDWRFGKSRKLQEAELQQDCGPSF